MIEDILRAADDAEHFDEIRCPLGVMPEIARQRFANPLAVADQHADKRADPLAPCGQARRTIGGKGLALGVEGIREIGDSGAVVGAVRVGGNCLLGKDRHGFALLAVLP